MDDSVPQKILVQKYSARGVHFRRAGPRQKVYFTPGEVNACIVTCGGLCPGLNTVVREIVQSLDYMYGVSKVTGIDVIDRSFGFDTSVEEAQRFIDAAHVSARSAINGIGVVKLVGRSSGFIAVHATLASRDVDCCLIPESPFHLEGEGGLFEYIWKRLKENARNGHMVIVIAEGAGQDLLAAKDEQDASGNQLLQDVGLWLSLEIEEHFSKQKKHVNVKYIDPTNMIPAIPSNVSDNIYCTLLAQSAVHGAMSGFTGFASGLVNGQHACIPFNRITEQQNTVVITDRMWARVLSLTNQPSFQSLEQMDDEAKKGKVPPPQLLVLDDAKIIGDPKTGNEPTQ